MVNIDSGETIAYSMYPRGANGRMAALLRSRLLTVAGQWQSKDGTTHLIVRRLVDMTPWLEAGAMGSRDVH
jgi:error-prone DNA polymerase